MSRLLSDPSKPGTKETLTKRFSADLLRPSGINYAGAPKHGTDAGQPTETVPTCSTEILAMLGSSDVPLAAVKAAFEFPVTCPVKFPESARCRGLTSRSFGFDALIRPRCFSAPRTTASHHSP